LGGIVMKVSKDKQKEILMSSFEILNGDYYENKQTIEEIIGKMFKLDIDIATQMWEYILTQNHQLLKSSDAYSLTEGIIYVAEKKIGEAEIANIVLSNNKIKDSVFKLSGDVAYNAIGIIRSKIENNELSIANELLEIVFANKYKEWSLYQVLDCVIPHKDEITQEAFDLLIMWIDKVRNKQEKAKLNVRMLEFMEDDDL